ncbi:MAG: gliding motility-associated C-terminal domain-containing protein [Bacteroidetes bacterium]|nr:gliding motility-associated C-terminal domain-containing protein [Bacteroidota bacterium]
MKSPKKLILLFVFALSLAFNKGWAQVNKMTNSHFANYIFDTDSLSGFDEESAKLSALSDGFIGSEFKVRMFQMKRQYINAKYNIVHQVALASTVYRSALVQPACTNEDFEGSAAAANITVSNQINGWTVTSGVNNIPGGTCNLNNITNTPGQSALIQCNTSTGFVDPIIGGCYPIYSVFGTTANSGNSVSSNSLLPPMGGDKVIRINNAVNDYSVEKLSKTFAVSANNALFQFAFISVFYPGHTCCDAGAFQIKLTNASANTVIACPNFSISAPSSQCAGTNTSVTYYIGGGACPLNNSSNFSPIFNKWNFNSLDLSSYIGNNITIDIIANDCTAGGHYGYVYFDAQCSPMTIVGNGTGFPAGSSNITLPTCGASGATITAPPGMGNYSWNSSQISIPANLTVPSPTNQTLITSQSGTVQLIMDPPGSCANIVKVITVTITPAPIAVASATQPSCTNPLSAASLTTAGSASVNPTIVWSPPPASVAANSLSATGLAVGITTITVTDNTGCKTTATVNILSAPPPVTFQVNNNTGSYSLSCLNPTINMSASTNYTYGTLSYSWASTSFTATGSNVAITQTGTYNVCGMDAATSCSMCQSFTINQNFTVPTNTVSPTSQIITCNAASAATFTSTMLSPTVNIAQAWYSPQAPYPVGPPTAATNGTTSLFTAGSPGIYTIEVCNQVNGCCNTKTVSVTSLAGFPNFATSSTNNYSLGCSPLNQNTLCIINATSSSGPVQYLFLPPGTPSAVPIATTAFGAQSCTMVSVPGPWTVVVQDPINGCQTALSVPIIQNTVAPNVAVAFGPGTQTLTCFTPTILATGSSSTTGAIVSWNVPPPATPPTVASPTIILGPPNGPNTSPTSTVYANYTVMVTSTVNACKSQSIVVVNQNFIAPTPSLAAGNPSVINCSGNAVTLSFTNNPVANAGIPGATATAVWSGPSPQMVLTGATYSAYIAGTYTIAVQNSKNGCIGTKTYVVPDLTQPPVLATPFATVASGCGSDAPLLITLSQSLTAWSVYFNEYPTSPPASFKPANAIQPVNSPTYTGGAATVTVDVVGQYEYVLTNMQTSCKTTGTFVVLPGNLNAGFTADPTTGYAPLSVGFNNTSATGAGATSSVTSVWIFGNGTSSVTSNPAPGTVYNAPGSYTVTMIATRGGCIDTAYQVIKVEIPSKMDIPNVFTPNGDGSNDLFFLKTQNLTDITATIFDRWGNVVYEVTSTTGNIGWDGKNQGGKECPSGTYFYIIKSTGKDGKAYDQKGNVSLYR